MGERQGEHQGSQYLGLAGAGGSDDQAVRTHALLGGLLDVQRDRLALGGQADRHPQPVTLQARPPVHRRVEVAHVPDAEQVDQLGGGRLPAVPGRPGLQVQRGEPARGGLGVRHGHLVGNGVLRGAGEVQHLDGQPAAVVGALTARGL